MKAVFLVVFSAVAFSTLFHSEVATISWDELTPETIKNLQVKGVTQVHFIRNNNSGKRCIVQLHELRRSGISMDSFEYVRIDECPNTRCCKELITNLRQVNRLEILSAGLSEFDFSLVASRQLKEISLNGNEGITLKGICIAKLTQFNCVECKLNPSGIESLFQFKYFMIAMDLRGNDVNKTENEMRKLFPNLQVLFMDSQHTTTILPTLRPNQDDNGSKKIYPCCIIILLCVFSTITKIFLNGIS